MKNKQTLPKSLQQQLSHSQTLRNVPSFLKIYICSLLFFTSFTAVLGQSRIAVVNGSTSTLKVYSTLDSALKMASNGDYVYLPGGSFPADTINKKLFIFGAGICQDSSTATSITNIIGSMVITNLASGGQLEGCYITGDIKFGTSSSDQEIQNYIVKRCYVDGNISIGYTLINQNSKNNFFLENIINGELIARSSINNYFQKNIIRLGVENANYSFFENNLIGLSTNYYNIIYYCNNTLFKNNIITNSINNSVIANSYNLTFINNLSNTGTNIPNDQISSGNKTASLDSIFIDISNTNIFKRNFRLKSFSPGRNMGTDATDVGIYGTTQPTKTGWIPTNPHISFKSVAQQTDVNGILKATFKVKAQNN